MFKPLWNTPDFKVAVLPVVVSTAFVNLLMLVPSIYLMQVFDRILLSQNLTSLALVSLTGALALVLMALFEWLRTRMVVAAIDGWHGRIMQLGFDQSLEVHSAAVPAMFAERGRLWALIDLQVLRQWFGGAGLLTLADVPWGLIYVLVCWALHPWLGLFALAVCLLQAVVALWGEQRLSDLSDRARVSQRLHGDRLAQLQRVAPTLVAQGMKPALVEQFLLEAERDRAVDAQWQGRQQAFQTLSRWVRHAQQSLGLALAAWLVLRGELSPGAMIAANLLVSRALAPIDQLMGAWRGWGQAQEAWIRLKALHQQAAQLQELAKLHQPPLDESDVVERVVLTGACMLRPHDGEPWLGPIDLTLQAGELVVVMGPSGSGKSSLARLVVGVWVPERGMVALTDSVGYLPQSVELLPASVAGNISRLREPDPAKVVDAARHAGVHELILQLPAGYETLVGDGGLVLSGGQSQRLGLARALYGKPALLVLDEPDAHLDDAGEKALQQAVAAACQRGAAVLVVSHRRSLLGMAQRVIVMNRGGIERIVTRTSLVAGQTT